MTSYELYILSNHLQGFGSFFLLSVSLFTLRFTKAIEVKMVLIYAAESLLFHLGQTISGIWFSYQYDIGDYFVLFELSLFLMLYYLLISKSLLRKLSILILMGFYLFFILYRINGGESMGSSIRALRDGIHILFSIIYFVYLMRNLPQERMSNIQMFWINSSVLFFFSCTFFLSLTMSYIVIVLKHDFSLYWAFRNTLRFVFCLVVSLGI
jgi:hypothetical protein